MELIDCNTIIVVDYFKYRTTFVKINLMYLKKQDVLRDIRKINRDLPVLW